jgi:hypothetical protein
MYRTNNIHIYIYIKMPYFKTDNINLLFIHIPKTGGSSLELYFSYKYAIELTNESLMAFYPTDVFNSSLQHLQYTTILKHKDLLKVDMDNNLKIITIVRNPYHRIVSDLFFFSLICTDSTQDDVYNIIESYLFSGKNYDNHNMQQYLFITNEMGMIIDDLTIFKTETLMRDMVNYGFTDFDIDVNKNSHEVMDRYILYLNEKSIKLINSFYDKDFSLFGYEKILVTDSQIS